MLRNVTCKKIKLNHNKAFQDNLLKKKKKYPAIYAWRVTVRRLTITLYITDKYILQIFYFIFYIRVKDQRSAQGLSSPFFLNENFKERQMDRVKR